ncbi:hypothetical protein PP485_gp54 [Gordonia phage ThankyouJordi]|uniref:Uncharacterized protein n=1 Tax=Gordonia phage ThankyouJordi TaxID=2571252 RepID=A0A4Y6EIJ3_9CAUD|nr:hypothetical protein PP485_gp54 [Gordonia phage ThankyouJordi]QCW22239.1 hypothetical protein SEA_WELCOMEAYANNA_54 [Gordonia phage WelcomeAyanna]QDF17815.1 hypothetical protein SEA_THANKYOUJORDI_54 [Gordonia phage ThankyouJordi]
MNGAAHYREAERLLVGVEEALSDQRLAPADRTQKAERLIDLAQVHATLALGAATALSGVISNNLASGSAINDLAHDSETIIAVNDWHEVASRGVS